MHNPGAVYASLFLVKTILEGSCVIQNGFVSRMIALDASGMKANSTWIQALKDSHREIEQKHHDVENAWMQEIVTVEFAGW